MKRNQREAVAVDSIDGASPARGLGAVQQRPAVTTQLRGLPRRHLGKTGVEVSALALGGVIGMQQPPSSKFDPAAIADAALNLGISYFDTSPDYSLGQSESNFGRVLVRRRQEVFLATKANSRGYDGTMRSVEKSLKRLQTDHLDLLQIHAIAPGEDINAWGKPRGVIMALHRLRDQKVTRFIGLTGHDSAAALRQAIERYDFDTLLTTLNPVARRKPFREDLLPVANRKGLGVIAMKVMGGGNGCLVTGNPLQQVLRPFHDRAASQMNAQLLLRYALGLPISTAVVGVASVDQLRENVAAARDATPMTLAERRELERIAG